MKRYRTRIAVAVISMMLVPQVPAILQAGVSAATGSVSGKVFEDLISNGAMDGSDTGISGVTVTAYDTSGASVGSTTTAGDGTYTLTVGASSTSAVRVEFSTPAGYQPAMLGTDNKSSVQLVSLGATNVSYGVARPANFCANLFAAGVQGDQLGSTCFQPVPTMSLPTVHVNQWGSRMGKTGVAVGTDTGSVWGLGYDGVRGLLWTSAAVRRYMPVGPKKLCGLYVTNPATGTLVASIDLKADFGMNCGDDTKYGASQNTDRDFHNGTAQSYDNPAYPMVGKAAFGDLDISPDGQYLFVTNLYDRKVYRFQLGGTSASPTLTAAGSWAVNSLCVTTGSVARPWAMEPTDGTHVYVGAVCTNEGGTVSTTFAPESGSVQLMTIVDNTTATWSTKATVSLGYVRACPHGTSCNSGLIGAMSKWHGWTDSFTSINALVSANNLVYPQPIISDIDFLDDGSMSIGLIDRFGLQMGNANLIPDATQTSSSRKTVFVDGDLLLFCKSGSSFVQESDGSCTGDSGTKGPTTWDGAYENATVGQREFFNDNYYDGAGLHPELSQGGIAVKPGSSEIAFTAMDPWDWVQQGGIRYLKQSNGDRTAYPYYTIVTDSAIGQAAGLTSSDDFSFMKSASMGDLEILCSNAPVQVGDRIWYDTNANGIQDAGEPGIAGVTVMLKRNADGLVWGTAVTDANGNFSFSSVLSEGWSGNGDNIGAGLVPNEAFTIEVSNRIWTNNFGTGNPLDGYQLTNATQLSAASPNDTSIDSNASVVSATSWQIPVTAPAPGYNNFTYDMGVTGKVSVGDLVFVDTNGNGIQDAGETGLAGAVLTLTDTSGAAVRDVNGNLVAPISTTSTGAYLFDNLPVGQYKVSITYPTGWVATKSGQGTTATDSSTNTATSSNLTTPGTSDLTLDFGVVPSVSVGDYVWYDANHDGLQDATDVPIQGVTLTLTKADGTTAYDVYGNAVTTTTTDSKGWYTFDNLPFGQYKVTVTNPAGYVPTVTGSGTTATDSSTTSATSVNLTENAQRDPTLDFGFWGEVSVGDYVWLDTNGDGVQDATDVPLQGITLTITKADGTPAYDSSGKLVTTTTTDAAGHYSFDHLAFGQYKVTVTAPPQYGPTKTGAGTTATDSSKGSATSVVLNTNGQRDPTLDFGFVYRSRATALKYIPNASVGDSVWRDMNGDGRHGAFDPGLKGAIVSILNVDGTPVTDVTGAVVKSVVTGKDGKYLFNGLPPGVKYVVRVKYPYGWMPTVPDRPGRDINSSSKRAVSRSVAAGESDMSLDFGVVSDKSILRLPATR